MNKLSTIFVVILSVAVGGCDTENQVQTVETSVQAGQSHDALWGVCGTGLHGGSDLMLPKPRLKRKLSPIHALRTDSRT